MILKKMPGKLLKQKFACKLYILIVKAIFVLETRSRSIQNELLLSFYEMLSTDSITSFLYYIHI
jgi:hypothetical protein